jgi:hypothetical protein
MQANDTKKGRKSTVDPTVAERLFRNQQRSVAKLDILR